MNQLLTPFKAFKEGLVWLFFVVFSLCAYAEPVRILGIGNSFTVDALEVHFQPLLTAEGVDAVIGYPYRGGTFLSQHDAWSNRTDTLPYNFRKFKDGKFTSTGEGTYSLKMAMKDEAWDYVIIQSDHDSVGIYKSYVPYMEHLISFVKANCSNPNVKIGFYMTWAYDEGSTYSGFKLYNKDQKVMYDSIINAAKQVRAKHPELTLFIPAGTAVQNARTSYIGQRMNRDGYHLNYKWGRYVAALSWYEVIFNKSALDVTWHPESITDYCADMCKNAVHAAVGKPYEVTSLAAEYSEPEHETIEPGTESHLRRMTTNGMSVLEDGKTEYTVKVDSMISPVALYAYPIDINAEVNITDKNGSDIERDTSKPWYYPLKTPKTGDTLTYKIRVISEAMGADETVYYLTLIGAQDKDLTYLIGCKDDLDDFAKAVNGGSYAINGELTKDFNMDHTKQECWMTPIGTESHPYTGTFDGKGHIISGFNIYSVNNDLLNWKYVGLFGLVRKATIKGLRIEGTEESYFNRPDGGTDNTGSCGYGILCGGIVESTIQDCSVSCPIFTNVSGAVGMLVGRNENIAGTGASTIERCSAEGTWRIRHKGIYAGILGYGYNCLIKNCYSLCKMNLQQDKAARMGGILGYTNTDNSRSVKLQNCYGYGALKPYSGAANTSYIGAIAGVFNGPTSTAENCWYLNGSAPAVFGQHKNYSTQQNATSATATQFTNRVVSKALGDAWKQGEKYPVFRVPGDPIDPDPDPEEETKSTESRLEQLKVNNISVTLTDGVTLYSANVDCTVSPTVLYASPMDAKAEVHVTDAKGAEVTAVSGQPNNYKLTTPEKDKTVSYTIRVIAEAKGENETVYTLNLKGVSDKEVVYVIESRADLESFAATVNDGNYSLNARLTKDINMNHTQQDCWMTPIGTKDHPYTGTFDGRGHTISGFNIYCKNNDLQNMDCIGLFGYIKGAMIKNLHITGTVESFFERPSTDDTADKGYGVLCGMMETSTIQDCSVNVPIFTNVAGAVGMLVGRNNAGKLSTIERCSAQGAWRIRHKGIYGGILGYGYYCKIKDCYSDCTMPLQQDKGARIGGILGYVNNADGSRSVTIENCHNYGKLSPFEGAANTSYIGAIAGYFNGKAVFAKNCWYLEGSAAAAFGQHKNYETEQKATSATETQFKDETVLAALGDVWKQGDKYPELVAPVIPVDPDDPTDPDDPDDPTPSDPTEDEPTTPEDLQPEEPGESDPQPEEPGDQLDPSDSTEPTEPEEPGEEGLDKVQRDDVQCTKVIEDGQLYIMYKGTKYNVQGKAVGN